MSPYCQCRSNGHKWEWPNCTKSGGGLSKQLVVFPMAKLALALWMNVALDDWRLEGGGEWVTLEL
jgi:hypothetical protein